MKYAIILCPRCGAVRYVKAGQKTAKCFECNYRITIIKQGRLNPELRILRIVNSPKTAVEIVKKLKATNYPRFFDTTKVRGLKKFRKWFREK